jgi:hypothetical protein
VAYFIVFLVVVKVALICAPRAFAATIIPIAISAAMRPYSMDVAPDSSFRKRRASFFMALGDPTRMNFEQISGEDCYCVNPGRDA